MSWRKPSTPTWVTFWRVRASLALGREAARGGWRQTCQAACSCLLGRAGAFCGPEEQREQPGSPGEPGPAQVLSVAKEAPAFSAGTSVPLARTAGAVTRWGPEQAEGTQQVPACE